MNYKLRLVGILITFPLGLVFGCAELQSNSVLSVFPSTAVFPSTTATETTAIRINCGGEEYQDVDGNVWNADFGYSANSDSYAVTSPIANTSDSTIYQSERFGKTLEYAIPVANGQYTLNLHFAEIYVDRTGERFFDVAAENETVLEDFDIAQAAGGPDRATIQTFPVTVSDGTINIQLSNHQPDLINAGAKINAIEIIPN